MSKAMAVLAGAVLVLGTMIVGVTMLGGQAKAAPQETWQYAYVVGVPRLESYEIDVSRWAASNEDKDYLKGHVFAYEQGQTKFSDQVNGLRRLNELAAQGWEVVDAKQGLVRRKR